MNTDNILTILVSIFIPLLTGLAFIAYNNPIGYRHLYKFISIGSIVLTFFFILIPQTINSAFIDSLEYIPKYDDKVLVCDAIDKNDFMASTSFFTCLIFNIFIYLLNFLKAIKDKDNKEISNNIDTSNNKALDK